ncbi:hypothetical protein [Chitinophaga sp. MM2321]|uniref:hypothetical protein n=1 Tax=Chitinophaga sp. MM2321 TaxID=3137178 RepID=UPI0032D57EDA
MKTIKHTDKELAEANIFPHGLSEEEKAAADKELLALRIERWNKRSTQEQLRDQLLQLKYQMESVTGALLYQEELHFGYFLSSYIQIIRKKQKEFAQEISLDETRLSRIIHRKESPNDELFIRLELHSRNTIPALNWFMLAEKERAYYINTSSDLRKKEKKNVLKTIKL